MPSPLTRRQTTRSQTPIESPLPIALARKSIAPTIIAGMRPNRSASQPAK